MVDLEEEDQEDEDEEEIEHKIRDKECKQIKREEFHGRDHRIKWVDRDIMRCLRRKI